MAGLDAERLVRPEDVRITARDGVELQGLLYLPDDSSRTDDRLPPVVFFVHGGPTGQSVASFNGVIQYHLDRGLAVFQPNVRGSTGFGHGVAVLDGASGGSLVNDGYLSAFDNPQERSWQLRHDYNFAGLGIPGLTLMNRYTSGSNIHTGGRTDAEEWSRETELAYTIQEGTLKNLNVRWRNSNVRRDVGQDLHENRLIINYPLSIL